MINSYFLRNKKLLISSLIVCVFSAYSFSQSINDDDTFWKNVQFGGGIGLNFGNAFFSGSLAPNAIYRLNSYVSVGAGLNFSYSSQKYVFKSTVLGGSIIGLFNPYERLQVSTEFEQLYVSRNFDEQLVSNTDDNYLYPALFLGAGYRTGNVTFGIRYDVLYDEDKSIYSEPWIPFVRFWF